MEYLGQGIIYILLELATVKLFVFVNSSFANNKDLSSQIGYVIILANEIVGLDEFIIRGNLIYWSSTKSKNLTRSILVSKIYGMVAGVDIIYAIGLTLKLITT
jgi:hypothetical protein